MNKRHNPVFITTSDDMLEELEEIEKNDEIETKIITDRKIVNMSTAEINKAIGKLIESQKGLCDDIYNIDLNKLNYKDWPKDIIEKINYYRQKNK